MLPLIDELEFREAYAAGTVPEPYLHAICIVAAKDKDAVPYLHSPDTETLVAPRDFCSSLQSSVKGALAVSGRYDRLTLIRMSALISFHAPLPDSWATPRSAVQLTDQKYQANEAAVLDNMDAGSLQRCHQWSPNNYGRPGYCN